MVLSKQEEQILNSIASKTNPELTEKDAVKIGREIKKSMHKKYQNAKR